MTRDEHLQLCKNTAIDYVNRGNLQAAIETLFSELPKHPETANHPVLSLTPLTAHLHTPDSVYRLIEGVR